MPEEWGGKTVMVEVSAKTKIGLPRLLEMILLVADLAELKADPDAPGSGTVLESRVDKGRGPVATVLPYADTAEAILLARRGAGSSDSTAIPIPTIRKCGESTAAPTTPRRSSTPGNFSP